MPPKMAPNQTFTAETIAVVLYALLESGVTLGQKHFAMMAAIDGERKASAFEHQFRGVKARAKEIHEQAKQGGGVATPVKKGKGEKGEGSGKKRGRKGKDEEESPSKKVKAEAKDEDEDEDAKEGEESEDGFKD